jgi:hypothetical protein
MARAKVTCKLLVHLTMRGRCRWSASTRLEHSDLQQPDLYNKS